MTDATVGSGGDGGGRGELSAVGAGVVALLVMILLVVVGAVAFFVVVAGTPDRGEVAPIGSASLAQRPTLEEYHAELWPLGHEFMRQVEAETGVTFALEPGLDGVTKCNLDQGWMEDSARYVAARVDVTTLDTIGRRVLSARYPAHSIDDHASTETVLYWTNPDLGSIFMTGIDRNGVTFVGWSSGCALSSVYPPPYTTPWPSGLPTWPTPLPDPEAPTVTASPLPSSPAARPTPTSSPS